MINCNPKNLHKLLNKYHIFKIFKKKGQHFLIDQNIIDKIIKEANLNKKDIVLEIGPGVGFLSNELAKRVSRLILIEIDKRFENLLRNEVSNRFKNVDIIIADALKIDFSNLKVLDFNYKIVSNLPYNISSQLIFKTLTKSPRPFFMLLMLQKEFARRLIEKGHFLYILSKLYCNIKLVHKVSKNCFFPKPKVDSYLVRIELKNKNIYQEKLKEFGISNLEFLKFVKLGFSERRKKLINCLNKKIKNKEKILEIFKKIGLPENIRAEQLEIEDWLRLISFKVL